MKILLTAGILIVAAVILKQYIDMKKMKSRAEDAEEKLRYFMHRDSLTGQMNKCYAIVKFKEISGLSGNGQGAVMVKISTKEARAGEVSDNERTAVSIILAAMGIGEVCHIESDEFLIFSDNCCRDADKVFGFLNRMDFDGLLFAVGAECFDVNEADFDIYMKRLCRSVAAAEIGGCRRAVH